MPGSVSFTSMPYGDYTLRVKAVNLASGQESMVKTLVIHINAPWYLSVWAKMALYPTRGGIALVRLAASPAYFAPQAYGIHAKGAP